MPKEKKVTKINEKSITIAYLKISMNVNNVLVLNYSNISNSKSQMFTLIW